MLWSGLLHNPYSAAQWPQRKERAAGPAALQAGE
jgi:hypothetical protein